MGAFNKDEWSKVRHQGKFLYVLLNWIIAAAIPSAIILSVVRGLFRGEGLGYFITSSYMRNLAITFILCTILSVFLGIRKWSKNERAMRSDT